LIPIILLSIKYAELYVVLHLDQLYYANLLALKRVKMLVDWALNWIPFVALKIK
jgi:hypothetical protein